MKKKQVNKALFGIYSPFMSKQTQPGFLKNWKAVRAKGFKSYYIHTVWRWFAFILLQQVLYCLLTFYLPTLEDCICVTVVGVALGSVFSLLLWIKHENEYEVRTRNTKRQQGSKSGIFSVFSGFYLRKQAIGRTFKA